MRRGGIPACLLERIFENISISGKRGEHSSLKILEFKSSKKANVTLETDSLSAPLPSRGRLNSSSVSLRLARVPVRLLEDILELCPLHLTDASGVQGEERSITGLSATICRLQVGGSGFSGEALLRFRCPSPQTTGSRTLMKEAGFPSFSGGREGGHSEGDHTLRQVLPGITPGNEVYLIPSVIFSATLIRIIVDRTE